MINNKETFLETIEGAIKNNDFRSIKISKASNKDSEYKNIFIKVINIKDELVFNFVFNNKTQDITKNYNLQDCIFTCDQFIGNDFKNAVLFTQTNDITLSYNKKGVPKIIYSKPTQRDKEQSAIKKHNNIKQRTIDTKNNIYLQKLGVINTDGITVNSKVGKLRQIHKFIETLSSSMQQSYLVNKNNIKITDMGSGKGYLTFAVYDYMKNSLEKNVYVHGIEYRKDLVEKCNDVALECCFDNLSFIQGTIQETHLSQNDILIALHACDTATDDAISKGIQSNSELIILSPCCHKQIRKEITSSQGLDSVIQHGIFKERQSEMVTDTLRGLIMESYGYKTKIFEYISDQHTHKNVMIVGIKHSNKIDTIKITNQIKGLKDLFGIKEFYLEKILK